MMSDRVHIMHIQNISSQNECHVFLFSTAHYYVPNELISVVFVGFVLTTLRPANSIIGSTIHVAQTNGSPWNVKEASLRQLAYCKGRETER